MSGLSAVCCCVLILALVHSSQSANLFDEFGVYCKPETYSQKVSKSGCDSQYVRVKACLGTCASYAYPLDHPPYFKKFCECCKPSSTRWKVFNLPNCASGISPLVQVESAVNCKCSACTWNEKHVEKEKHSTELETWIFVRQSLIAWLRLNRIYSINNASKLPPVTPQENVILVSRNLCVT